MKPAFPIPLSYDANGQIVTDIEFGLSDEEWFAGMALMGLLSNPANGPRESADWIDKCVAQAKEAGQKMVQP